jgi:hypothetical protein
MPLPAHAQPAPRDGDDAAIWAIVSLRGAAFRDEHAPGRPVTWVRFFERVQDGDLDLIRDFAHLEYLDIHKGAITDAGLGRLTGLTRLAALHIEESSVTKEGLAHLVKLPRLERLSLYDCPVNDADLQPLEGMAQLRELSLVRTNVTEDGVARLKAALPYALIDRLDRSDEQAGGSRGREGGSFLAWVAAIMAGPAALFLLSRRWQWLSRRPWMWRVAVVVGMIVVAELALLRLAPLMEPIRDGDPAVFWLHACKIDVGVRHARRPSGGFYQPRDGWLVYYVQGFHGRYLYRVKEEDAAALFPAVVARLERAPPGALSPEVQDGAREWLRSDPAKADIHLLLGKLREASLARMRKADEGLYQYVVGEEDAFSDRWQRLQRYHWNVIFESLFFAGFILLAAWPWLRGASYLRWALHLGLLPPLFFLPFWLGYAQLSFTSAGPTGGVLYPVVIAKFRGLPWTSLDTAIVRSLPQVLEPLSQTTGPMLSLSGFGAVGPVATLVMSGLLLLTLGGLKVFVPQAPEFWAGVRFSLARLRSTRRADEGSSRP